MRAWRLAWVLGGLFSLSAAAQASPASVAKTPAAGGRPGLAVGFDSSGQLKARVCQTEQGCGVEDGQVIEFPADLKSRLNRSRLSIVPIAKQRAVVHVLIPRVAPGFAWEAVLGVSAQGKLEVVFSGETGLTEGVEGERRGAKVFVSPPAADGARRVVVGEVWESLNLCGREAVMSPQLLVPEQLQLRPAKMQRLSAEERASAQVLKAIAVAAEEEPLPSAPLLRAISASSAVGDPANLTDGNIETVWAENRGGDGKGEFVLMLAPPELPLGEFELVVKPLTQAPAKGAAPKSFFLVFRELVYKVEMPEDAWQQPGRRYRISLPAPVASDCLALVTDEAFSAAKDAQVSFAELRARSEFDLDNLDGLVAALAGGGDRAQAASALLRSLGEPAFTSVARRYLELDEQGRRLALDVIDHAACEQAALVYVEALLSEFEAHRIHAERRIRRCGDEAVPHLIAALDNPKKPEEPAALALAFASPSAALDTFVQRIPGAPAKRRAIYRSAIAVVDEQEAGQARIKHWLEQPDTPPEVQVELLRALGGELSRYGAPAERRLLGLVGEGADFRTRYLLTEPLAQLAGRSKQAQARLGSLMVKDPSHHVRAQAARVVSAPQLFQAELLRALSDEQVRVREAAAQALSSKRAGFAEQGLIQRLGEDKWPMVRSAAARSLAELPASARVDAALAAAVRDESISVRRPAILALGSRGALKHAPVLAERLKSRDEDAEVRAAAAMALGRMCSKEHVNLLTDYAQRLASPHTDAETRGIAAAALLALARIKPADLSERLKPFFAKETPAAARRAAQSALAAPKGCAGS